MGSYLQISISYKYKCCLPVNNEDVETDDENENYRQIVNQIPVIEKEKSEESFATTIIPCRGVRYLNRILILIF